MAGRLAKAIWFDDDHQIFTSSTAYYKNLPDWLVTFDKQMQPIIKKPAIWTPLFDLNSIAYDFPQAKNFKYSPYGQSLIGREINKLVDFFKTPMGSQLLFNLAKNVVDNNINDIDQKPLLLWFSISNLDKVAHSFGPQLLKVSICYTISISN